MPTAQSDAQSTLVSTYYDTPTLALLRMRLSLRVRKQGRSFLQTVKTEDLGKMDVLARREWEDPITGNQPSLHAPKTGARLPKAIRREGLRPLFITTVRRKTIQLAPTPSTRIEAALDEGEIRTADGSAIEPIREIELELKCGDPVALYDVALELLKLGQVRLEMRSKSERGYRLLGRAADVPQAVQAGPITLDCAVTVEAALQLFGQRCLNHLLRNEPVVLAGEPEGVHQMRVAVRRLRSVLSALKPMLSVEHHRWASKELNWVTDSLAPARNWEIFVGDLLHTVSEALPDHHELEHALRVADRCKRAAFDDVKEAILSRRHTEVALRLLQWFAARGWRDQAVSEGAALLLAPILEVAPDVIEKCYRKARQRCKRLKELTPAQRHKLRIALKKLRYTIEFVGSLYDKDEVAPFLDRLKSLQDYLGHANDVRVAQDLVDQLQEPKDHDARAIDRAGGIVLGWHERDLIDREPTLTKHVRRFRQLDPFW